MHGDLDTQHAKRIAGALYKIKKQGKAAGAKTAAAQEISEGQPSGGQKHDNGWRGQPNYEASGCGAGRASARITRWMLSARIVMGSILERAATRSARALSPT